MDAQTQGELGEARSDGDVARTWRLLTAFWQGKPTAQVIDLARAAGGSGTMCPEAQRTLMWTCLHHPISEAFPPNGRYATKVLKQATEAAEADGEECDDDLVEALCSRLAGSSITSSLNGDGDEERPEVAGNAPLEGWGHKVFAYCRPAPQDDGHPREIAAGAPADLLEDELAEGCVSGHTRVPVGDGCSGLIVMHLAENMFEGSTGCHEWEAGFLLAELVLSHPQLFRGRRCLELGCGAGVVGVCLSRVGAKTVTCTDGDADTVDNCRRNLQANGAAMGTNDEGGCCCRRLQWEDGWAALCDGPSPPDVIVGADLLYDPGVIPALVSLLEGMATPKGECEAAESGDHREQESEVGGGCGSPSGAACAAYIATTLRNEATLEAFVAAVQGSSELVIEDVTAELFAASEAAASDDKDRSVSTTAGAVRFVDLALLEDRGRIWVHRITPLRHHEAPSS